MSSFDTVFRIDTKASTYAGPACKTCTNERAESGAGLEVVDSTTHKVPQVPCGAHGHVCRPGADHCIRPALTSSSMLARSSAVRLSYRLISCRSLSEMSLAERNVSQGTFWFNTALISVSLR